MEPGPLLASGRAADVFDLGDGTVLRRYRSDHDVAGEARLMLWLAQRGFPVPEVHRADGRDLVMAMLQGPTMLEDLARHPWRLVGHARVLARLQQRLNDLQAPEWLGRKSGVPAGDSVLHLDLHPMNVMFVGGDPMVIDWTNASRGPASFDAAMTSVLMSTAELPARRDRMAVRLFVGGFEMFRGRALARSSIREAATYRLADPNITDVERARLRRQIG